MPVEKMAGQAVHRDGHRIGKHGGRAVLLGLEVGVGKGLGHHFHAGR
jgi:hypothetical protein